MAGDALAGKVVAVIGRGDALHRSFAVAAAEAGASIALATTSRTQDEEFAVNSIANEVWAIGPEQFVCLMDAREVTEVTSFAEQTWDQLGRCDILVCAQPTLSTAPLDELSADEWVATIATNLTAPFLAAQAFGRLMERARAGRILFVQRDGPADAASRAASAGLKAVAAAINESWSDTGVTAAVVSESFVLA
jgi:NAD(P)-dependent dehydrogenase (short-subunit alcohol dehydrogenase family)